MLASRRDNNLCDILVHSKTAKLTKTSGGGEFYDIAENKTYRTIPKPKCTLGNVIHALLCDICKVTIFVRETERSVKERVSEHMRDVKNLAEKPIMKHFSGHNADDMCFVVLQSLGRGGGPTGSW